MCIIGELLHRLGIRPHLRGYYPLFEGIMILVAAGRLQYVPYPEILRQIDTIYDLPDTAHAMRDAIASGVSHRPDEYSAVFLRTSRPGNKEFLYTVAEIARDRFDRCSSERGGMC